MIKLKTKSEIEQIRKCGTISSNLYMHLTQYIEPGISTLELDRISEAFIRAQGAIPSFKGYMGFPFSICASVNEEIIHGLPSSYRLKEGDIIGVDVGIQQNGMISDSSRTFAVGKIDEKISHLMNVTEKALYKAISKVKNGAKLNDIGGTVEDYVKKNNYGIVRGYCGHGVGYKNHEEPEVPNYRFKGGNKKLKTGMVIAIEPMVNIGDDGYFVLDDGWTVVTIDGEFSAHFEHTVAVTDTGFDILTVDPADYPSIMKKFFSKKG